jgi:hypothetical protein
LQNDCALTVDPADNTIFLLSTIPGERFRQVYAAFDDLAALTRERRELDNIISPAPPHSILKRILSDHYTTQHQALIRVIPQTELSDVSHTDLARGSFGAVTTATWRRKSSVEHKYGGDVPVVLKRLQDKFDANEAFARFSQEVGGSRCEVEPY